MSATPAQQTPLRALLVGCGSISRIWLQFILTGSDIEIVGLVDASVEQTQQTAAMFRLEVPHFTDLQAALGQTGPDLVIDCTPPSAHPEVTIASLEAGCDVLGEKPMALSLAEAEEMVATAARTGRRYIVMQNRRYTAGIRGLRTFVESGALGRLDAVCADYFASINLSGFRLEMEAPLLVDMAVHHFDESRFITGLDAVSVYCQGFNPTASPFRNDAAAFCTFEMSDGSVFDYRGSWGAIGLHTSWDAQWRLMGGSGSALWDGALGLKAATGTITGTADAAIEPSSSFASATPLPPAGEWAPDVTDLRPVLRGHGWCLEAMVAALRSGNPGETEGYDNIRSLAMVLTAVESARQRTRLEVPRPSVGPMSDIPIEVELNAERQQQ